MPSSDWLLPTALRRLPFTFALASTILVTAAVTGTLTNTIHPDQLATWGFGADDLASGRWLQLARSTFQTFDPFMSISMLATVLALVGACEYRLGTRRTVLVYALAHGAGSLAIILVARALAARGNAWGMLLASQQAVGASAGSIGALGAWLMFFPPPRRTVLIGVCALFLAGAFMGQVHPWDIAHVAGCVVGLAMGVLWAPRGSGVAAEVSRENRRLAMAWIALIVGLAAALAPFVATDELPLLGARARFGERGLDVARWLFLFAAAAAWACSPGLRRGESRARRGALGVAAVTGVGLWQPGAPGVEHILSILLFIGLVVWRSDFSEPSASGARRGWRAPAAMVTAAFVYVVFGLVAVRFHFAPPLGGEGSVQAALARLRFHPVRTPNWDSPGAHWFLQSIPFVVYGCAACALIVWIRSGKPRNLVAGQSSSGRSVKSA